MRQNKICKILMLCFATWHAVSANSQTLTERLIVEDTPDSLFQKAYNVAFNKEGKYCFIVEKGRQNYYAITNNDTTGPFEEIRTTYNTMRGDLMVSRRLNTASESPFYYSNGKSTKMYGPITGKIIYSYSGSNENIAITTWLNDTLHFYLNGVEKARGHQTDYKENEVLDSYSFSDNGQHYICSIKIDTLHKLYIDDRIVDSSKHRYIELAINDKGDYTYAKGYEPPKPIGKYDYMFFIHHNDTSLPYVRTAWHNQLLSDGAYYYSGKDYESDHETNYIIVNDKLYRGFVYGLILLDKNNYLFKCNKAGKEQIIVNSKFFCTNFDKIFMPTMDSSGNFALYGLKNYYLYKYVNGRKIRKPLSKYGVRATPLYISPTGESLHYYATDDSTYLYHDDKLVFPPIPNEDFTVHQCAHYLRIHSLHNDIHSLFYIGYGEKAYWVYDGVFSRPIIPYPKRFSPDNVKGNNAGGELTNEGFYAIQQTDKKQYQVIINNKTYVTIEGIDKIVGENRFFDGTSLTFYVIKNNAYYQYVIK